jgi:beta-mannanase
MKSHAHRQSSRARRILKRTTVAFVPVMLVAGLFALLAVQAGSSPLFQHPTPQRPAVRALAANVSLGVTTTPLAQNWWREWRRRDLRTVSRFERATHVHAQIVMWYADWQHDGSPPVAQLAAIARRGSTPEITWEPWDASKGLHRAQPRYRLRNIIDGKFDPYIRSWARSLAAFRRPVLLRFAQEMDGNWYPWDEHANGNRRGEFVRAWRHIHDIFAAERATNVKWIWSPAFAIRAQQFPGPQYVDTLGLTCLNAGRRARGGRWRSFAKLCARPIGELHALAPAMPIQLSEVGTSASGGSQAAWIAGMFAYLGMHPEVGSLVWFNVRGAQDWVLQDSSPAQREFAIGISSPRVS